MNGLDRIIASRGYSELDVFLHVLKESTRLLRTGEVYRFNPRVVTILDIFKNVVTPVDSVSFSEVVIGDSSWVFPEILNRKDVSPLITPRANGFVFETAKNDKISEDISRGAEQTDYILRSYILDALSDSARESTFTLRNILERDKFHLEKRVLALGYRDPYEYPDYNANYHILDRIFYDWLLGQAVHGVAFQAYFTRDSKRKWDPPTNPNAKLPFSKTKKVATFLGKTIDVPTNLKELDAYFREIRERIKKANQQNVSYG